MFHGAAIYPVYMAAIVADVELVEAVVTIKYRAQNVVHFFLYLLTARHSKVTITLILSLKHLQMLNVIKSKNCGARVQL